MGSTPSITSHPFRLVGAALAAVVLLGACSANDDAATSVDPRDAPASIEGSDGSDGGELLFSSDADMDGAGVEADDAAESTSDAAGPAARPGAGIDPRGFDLGEIGREVAVEMRITMRSDDLRSTVDGILDAAAAGGGGVAATDVDYGTETRDGRATVVVKVPPRSLSALLAGLDGLGEVVSIGQDALDVTDQLTDLDVRIRNASQSVDRVRALLADATDLREVIDLESELTRRQTDLERLQASQRNLQDRVALATVTIQVFPTSAPIVDVADDDPGIADGFRTGWDAFVGVLFGLVYGVAVIAPLLAVLLVAIAVGWKLLGTRRRTRSTTSTSTPTPTPTATSAAHRPPPPSDDDSLTGDSSADEGRLSDAATASRPT